MRRLPALVLLAVASGCFELDFPTGLPVNPYGTGPGCWICDPVILTIRGGYRNVLTGDTVRLDALLDGHALESWSIDGSALRFRQGDSLTGTIASGPTTVLVRAITAGSATVRAAAKDTLYEARLSMRVLDSTGITNLTFVAPDTIRIPVGQSWSLAAHISDTSREPVTWYPPLPSVSDTGVVALTSVLPTGSGIGQLPFVLLRGRSAGTALVIHRFRELRDTVVVVVTP